MKCLLLTFDVNGYKIGRALFIMLPAIFATLFCCPAALSAFFCHCLALQYTFFCRLLFRNGRTYATSAARIAPVAVLTIAAGTAGRLACAASVNYFRCFIRCNKRASHE